MVPADRYLLSEKEVDYLFEKLDIRDQENSYGNSKTGFNSNLAFSFYRIRTIVEDGWGSLEDLADELERANQ